MITSIKILLCVLLLAVSSCTVADIGRFAAEKAIGQLSLSGDTLAVKFSPVYFKINLRDTVDYEKDTLLSGYRVWLLHTGGVLRVEVQKLDTTMVIK